MTITGPISRIPIVKLMSCLEVLIFSFTKHPEKAVVEAKVIIIILSCSNNQCPVFNRRYRRDLWVQPSVTLKDSGTI